MAYSIIVSPRAQKEIENAIEYYALYSVDAPLNFVTKLKDTYDILEDNPFLRIRYKNTRAIKIEKFPYLLYFVLNERITPSEYFLASTAKEIPKKGQTYKKGVYGLNKTCYIVTRTSRLIAISVYLIYFVGPYRST